jgi:hypothetical protein
MSKYYDNARKIEALAKQIKELEEADDFDAAEALREARPEVELGLKGRRGPSELSKLRKEISALRERQRELDAEGGTTRDRREIDREVADKMREFNRDAREARRGG